MSVARRARRARLAAAADDDEALADAGVARAFSDGCPVVGGPPSPDGRPPAPDENGFCPGMRCRVRFNSLRYRFYNATVTSRNEDGTYEVLFEDQDTNSNVPVFELGEHGQLGRRMDPTPWVDESMRTSASQGTESWRLRALMGAPSPTPWSCSTCTFVNKPGQYQCRMCGTLAGQTAGHSALQSSSTDNSPLAGPPPRTVSRSFADGGGDDDEDGPFSDSDSEAEADLVTLLYTSVM